MDAPNVARSVTKYVLFQFIASFPSLCEKMIPIGCEAKFHELQMNRSTSVKMELENQFIT